MGMFDWIEVANISCQGCGKELSGFQSKDGECLLQRLTPEESQCPGLFGLITSENTMEKLNER